MDIDLPVSSRFVSFIDDWDYEQYLLLGGYGSGKSYHIAIKIILKLLEEKRTALVVRSVYDTIKDSCFSLFKDIISKMGMLSDTSSYKSESDAKIVAVKSPMELRFPSGSRVIFKGMDNPEKLKSVHGVSIVWLEECSEVRYDGYKELLGRIREPGVTLHFFLSCNPVGRENWVYQTFFKKQEDDGTETVIQDEEELYKRRTLVGKNGIYYHHSLSDDNPFLPESYIPRLDSLRTTDPQLWVVARWGRFGANGVRVLPNFYVAKNAKKFREAVTRIPSEYQFFGLDFGFETSYNALISCCVDVNKNYLYIYDEVYANHLTDDIFCKREDVQRVKDRAEACGKPIAADSAEPKTIQYYRQQGFTIYGAKKYPGSRLQNTKKIKRFKKIICSPICKNTIRELKDLTYKKDSRGNAIYDDFTIDPHTFKSKELGVYKLLEKRGRLRLPIRAEVMYDKCA